MKIVTYNINGINGRLPVLLHWLAQAQPDVFYIQAAEATEVIAAIGKNYHGYCSHKCLE